MSTTSVPNPPRPLNGNNSARVLLLILVLLTVVACGNGNGDDKDSSENDNAPTQINLADTVELRVIVGRATAFDLPDRNANEVFTLVEGDRVDAAGRSEPDALGTVFYVVRFGNATGWIVETQVEVVKGNAEDLLITPNDAYSLSVPQETSLAQARTAEGPATPSFAAVAVARGDGAPVYGAIDRSSEIIVRLETGTELEILASTTPDQDNVVWYWVRMAQTDSAWVTDIDFEVIGNLQTRQQIILATSTPTATLEPRVTVTNTLFAPTTDTDNTDSTSSDLTATPTPSPTLDAPSPLESATTTPTLSRTPRISVTPAPTVTPRSIRQAEPPLLEIDLPAGWEQEHVLVPIESAFVATEIVLSLYEGPLASDVTGRITVLWRFTEVVPQSSELTLWPNAVLYLRSLLFRDCSVADHPELRRTYVIGGRDAIGSILQVINCLDGSPDLAGWFAALDVDGENYVFYMTIEPADRIQEMQPELRSIVESIRFISVDDAP